MNNQQSELEIIFDCEEHFEYKGERTNESNTHHLIDVLLSYCNTLKETSKSYEIRCAFKFWNLVKSKQWNKDKFRPIFLAVWFHGIKNLALIKFLGKEVLDLISYIKDGNIQYGEIQLPNEKVVLYTNKNKYPNSFIKDTKTYCLPKYSSKNINIVVVDSVMKVSTRMAACTTSTPWPTYEPVLHVPPCVASDAETYIKNCRTYDLTPPCVKNQTQLIDLIHYFDNVFAEYKYNALYLLYKIKTKKCGNYLTLVYENGAPYDDPYNYDRCSPASYCRGTTLYEDEKSLKLVRSPMNRGREIDYKTFSEDHDIKSTFYEKVLRHGTAQTVTAKVDGILLLVFKDVADNTAVDARLKNNYGLLFGTKSDISIQKSDVIDTLIAALRSMNIDVNEFAHECSNYMREHKVSTMTFEITTDMSRDELVTKYTGKLHGVYYLGSSCCEQFKPYYLFPKSQVFMSPEFKKYTYEFDSSDISDDEDDQYQLFNYKFDNHIEGTVIWYTYENMYFPMKRKTAIYYLLHSLKITSKASVKQFNNEIFSLIDEYGWYGHIKPFRKDLTDKKKIITLLALVNLPEYIFQQSHILKLHRDEYDKMYNSTIPENKSDAQRWHKFRAVYVDGKYHNAYNLV